MGRVLVVEDDDGIRELIRMILADAGHEALIALDGEQAIHLARTQIPQLILMDLNLPEVNGADACRAIKSDPATEHIPIIAMSAAQNIRAQLGQLTIDGFVAKPFDVEDLMTTIEALVPVIP